MRRPKPVKKKDDPALLAIVEKQFRDAFHAKLLRILDKHFHFNNCKSDIAMSVFLTEVNDKVTELASEAVVAYKLALALRRLKTFEERINLYEPYRLKYRKTNPDEIYTSEYFAYYTRREKYTRECFAAGWKFIKKHFPYLDMICESQIPAFSAYLYYFIQKIGMEAERVLK